MKTRKDSFFGLHFDFHAHPDSCPDPIGNTLSEDDIREICTLLRPDFLQIDCKGHPGWASYPSETGNAMPSFSGDPLALWRRVTKEEDVALYLHYSGVIDANYCAKHPDEAVMNADGKRSEGGMASTRTAGAYADEQLIPQLKELALKYGVNGAWVDGDCWGTHADFDPRTVKMFEQTTGISLDGKLPAKPDDPYYDEYREFCRELFRAYVRKYVNVLHEACPGFQIASNWAYSDHMPEKVSSDADFISGDFSPEDSLNTARYAARAIAQQNKTWDLMAWNFRCSEGYSCPKHPVQIMQEAASVISLGGGFQNYITQYRDGSPRMEMIRQMKPLADFMRAREKYCFRGKAKHQVAVLLSTFDRHKESSSLFSRNGMEKIMGLTVLLCDSAHSTEIVSEHTLEGRYAEYPVIAVPELYCGLEEKTVRELLEYAGNGGSLLITGQHTCGLFAKAGAPFTVGEKTEKQRFFTLDGENYGAVYGSRSVAAENAQTVVFVADSGRDEKQPLASVISYGKGKIAVLGADFGSAYNSRAQYLHRKVMNALLEKLYVPAVRLLSCEGRLEMTDLIKDGREYIQLVNVNGDHSDPTGATEDSILPCRDVALSIEAAEKPEALILRPSGEKLAFSFRGGRAETVVPRVDIHEIIEIVR